jgi:hypothetical protein
MDTQKIEIPKVELEWEQGETIVKFTPEYRRPSMKVQDALLAADAYYRKQCRALDKEYKDLIVEGYATMSAEQKAQLLAARSDEQTERASEKMGKFAKAQKYHICLQFRAIINLHEIKEKDTRDAMDKDEFWFEQNLSEMESAVNSFREINKI